MEKHHWFPTLLIFIIAGCTVVQTPAVAPTSSIQNQMPHIQTTTPISISTKTASPVRTSTSTLEPTKTNTASPTKTIPPTARSTKRYEDLKPGQYIVYTSLETTIENPTTADLKVISLESKASTTLAKLEYRANYFLRLSPDLKQVAYISENGGVWILDLKTGAKENIYDDDINGCLGLAWSPDSTRLVMACDNIFVFIFPEAKLVRLTNRRSGETTFFHAVTWSPDGKWIAGHTIYDQMVDRGGELYMIDPNCIKNVDTCLVKEHILDKVSSEFFSPTWSPYGHSLAAFLSQGVIGVWDIEGKTFHKVIISDFQKWYISPEWRYLAWSPDGKWFAYSEVNSHQEGDQFQGVDLFVIPVKGGQSKLVLGNTDLNLVMGWVVLSDALQE